MVRILVDLPERQVKDLAAIAAAEKSSPAEVIRKAVAAYIDRKKVPPASVFGIWKDRGGDGLAYQEWARSEW